jgi:hypothetical protein
MDDQVFISYSRRDAELVERLAADLDRRVGGGVWFDRSDLQAGQVWREEIARAVRGCTAFILVVSPDSVRSPEARREVDLALRHGRTVIPVIYRDVRDLGDLADVVRRTQHLDLRRGSYADNLDRLVDALRDAGVGPAGGVDRPFLREDSRVHWGAVVARLPGWALAWALGWFAFWGVLGTVLTVAMERPDDVGTGVVSALRFAAAGGVGGAAGGLLAGFFTMVALRRYAGSIGWRHMAPAATIWAVVGTLSIAGIWLVGAAAERSVEAREVDCTGLDLGKCLGATVGEAMVTALGSVFAAALAAISLAVVAWFLTGALTGWLAVRRIRRLEPAVRGVHSFATALGWGLGALLALVAAVLVWVALSPAGA